MIYNGHQLLFIGPCTIPNIIINQYPEYFIGSPVSQHSSTFDNKSQNQHFNDVPCSIRSILSIITYLDFFLIGKVKTWVRTFTHLCLINF